MFDLSKQRWCANNGAILAGIVKAAVLSGVRPKRLHSSA
jgi:hypothetical protein